MTPQQIADAIKRTSRNIKRAALNTNDANAYAIAVVISAAFDNLAKEIEQE